ncbi:MAG: mechanosensitive ion channel family protein [Thermoanaerobaculia bacterium]
MRYALRQMTRALSRALVLAGVLAGPVSPALAQILPLPGPTPAAGVEPVGDPYRRETPYGTFFGYIRAAQKENWAVAGEYLQWPKGGRISREELARQLKALLDESFVGDLEKLSRSPTGDVSDALTADLDLVGIVGTGDDSFDLVLVRTTPEGGPPIWLVASRSLREVPAAFKGLASPAIESHIPSFLKRPVGRFRLWQLLSFLLLIPVLYAASRLLVRGAFALLRHFLASSAWWTEILEGASGFRGPIAVLLTVPLHRTCVSRLALPLLSRYYYAQLTWLVLIFGVAWLLFRLVDFLNGRATSSLLAAGARATSSLTIARRMLRGAVVAAALLAGLASMGVNLTATLAGLGIGGLAVAFAAQRSLENLFGGFVVLSDRILRVGDVVRIGTVEGAVEDVTLYATRVRTLERTVVSIPNGSLVTSQIENLSRRDKFLFRHVLGLTYETTATQLQAVLDGCRTRLAADARVETATPRVRFLKLNTYTLDVEVFAYLLVPDWASFLAAQEELLLALMLVVEGAGSGFAFPTQTTYLAPEAAVLQPGTPPPAEPRPQK